MDICLIFRSSSVVSCVVCVYVCGMGRGNAFLTIGRG